jgi:hypothetical protein
MEWTKRNGVYQSGDCRILRIGDTWHASKFVPVKHRGHDAVSLESLGEYKTLKAAKAACEAQGISAFHQ